MKWIVGCIIVAVACVLLGCQTAAPETKAMRSKLVTSESLLAKGFQQDPKNADLYRLGKVTLKVAMERLGFGRPQMERVLEAVPGTIAVVKLGDIYFVIESDVLDDNGQRLEGSLDNDDAPCTVSASLLLVPSAGRTWRL